MKINKEATTADLVKALVQSHASGDDDQFYAIALHMAARAARSGRGYYAQELRNVIDESRTAHESPSARTSPSLPHGVSRAGHDE
jgi:hypothetical protein